MNTDSTAFDEKHLDDEACGRLLEVYVQEAERYDTGLVQSWKDDMDITLVFAGLYSGILTAFVIESYQRLQEDPADASVVLLQRISEQLAASNGSDSITQDEFKPTSAALACNILWFLSLILALFCAFLATFVQQWSRQFLHRTGQLRSPTPHARLLSFLYFGLKSFGMHTAVNLIPSMLHFSFFLFLGGLVAFLQDVNLILAYIVVGALAIVTVVYIGFTIWPLIMLNCPYQTPLSPIAWQIWQGLARTVLPPARNIFKKLQSAVSPMATYMSRAIHPQSLPTSSHSPQTASKWRRIKTFISPVRAFLGSRLMPSAVHDSQHPRPKKSYTLSDAIIAASQIPHRQRDMQSIAWALSSLTDDQDLLPFVEALPDAIYGLNGVNDDNLHLLKPLVETTNPEVDVISRITSLMVNASNTWFDEKHRKRCEVACPKALWALAFMVGERPGEFDVGKTGRGGWFPERVLDRLLDACHGVGGAPDRVYAPSALVLCALGSATRLVGSGVAQFLQASGEVKPFKFERTSEAINKALSGGSLSDHCLISGIYNESLLGGRIVPRIDDDKPLRKDDVARLDVVLGLCLRLPSRYDIGDGNLMLEYIHKRAQADGWGSTGRIWDTCNSPHVGAFYNCRVNRHSCDAMREWVYARIPTVRDFEMVYDGREVEREWVAAVGLIIGDPQRAAGDADDTSLIALQTMIGMRMVFVGGPEEAAEVSDDGFEFVRRYVEREVLCFENEPWTDRRWDDPVYGEDVEASHVALLTTRLLQRFHRLAAGGTNLDPTMTNDILDALEFIMLVSNQSQHFQTLFGNDPTSGAAIGDFVAVPFSESTLDICRWWDATPVDQLDSNAGVLEIMGWMWAVWGYFEVPTTGEARRNLEKAVGVMLESGVLEKVEECQVKVGEGGLGRRRVKRCEEVEMVLGHSWFEQRLDFESVLSRYGYLGDDGGSVRSWEESTHSDRGEDEGYNGDG